MRKTNIKKKKQYMIYEIRLEKLIYEIKIKNS